MTVENFATISCFNIIEPRVVAARLSARQTALLSQALRRNLEAAFSRLRPLGSDARCTDIRTSVVSVGKANVAANAVFGIALLPVLPSNGGVVIEGEAWDAATNRQLAALQWSKAGNPLDLLGGLSATGQARNLTKRFARRFVALVAAQPGGRSKAAP